MIGLPVGRQSQINGRSESWVPGWHAGSRRAQGTSGCASIVRSESASFLELMTRSDSDQDQDQDQDSGLAATDVAVTARPAFRRMDAPAVSPRACAHDLRKRVDVQSTACLRAYVGQSWPDPDPDPDPDLAANTIHDRDSGHRE